MQPIEKRMAEAECSIAVLQEQMNSLHQINSDLEIRLRHIEKMLWIGAGILLAAQAFLQAIFLVIERLLK